MRKLTFIEMIFVVHDAKKCRVNKLQDDTNFINHVYK